MPLLAACCLSATRLFAHEFWIEPVEFQVESGAPLVADFRNGQNFRGATLAYFEKQSARFDLIQGGKVSPVRPRLGDIPALQATAGADGLLVIVHQTMPSTLNYAKWEKFQAFADHKDFPDIRARHLARGLPESGFTESYTRHAKALVAVGHGRGQDVATGMETEFVARANPYTDNLTDGLPVQLLYQGRPRADAQVEVFQRDPAGVVTIRLLRTDARGQVRVPVLSGHAYLLDAVVLREMPTDSPEVWQSLWAALSFAVP
ncbi:DUF4198 domain-containing protein [Sedimentitalea sp. HM32M-2]|uniref:DUF4198 domain-containing protein n=1 Tax=Sedimentitalea sp. HM32M-2 TaxID=3351566 RepID=UPI0036D3E91D